MRGLANVSFELATSIFHLPTAPTFAARPPYSFLEVHGYVPTLPAFDVSALLRTRRCRARHLVHAVHLISGHSRVPEPFGPSLCAGGDLRTRRLLHIRRRVVIAARGLRFRWR